MSSEYQSGYDDGLSGRGASWGSNSDYQRGYNAGRIEYKRLRHVEEIESERERDRREREEDQERDRREIEEERERERREWEEDQERDRREIEDERERNRIKRENERELNRWIFQLGGADVATRLRAASSTRTSAILNGLLDFLAEDSESRVRLAVAKNPHTRKSTIYKLADDTDVAVREEAQPRAEAFRKNEQEQRETSKRLADEARQRKEEARERAEAIRRQVDAELALEAQKKRDEARRSLSSKVLLHTTIGAAIGFFLFLPLATLILIAEEFLDSNPNINYALIYLAFLILGGAVAGNLDAKGEAHRYDLHFSFITLAFGILVSSVISYRYEFTFLGYVGMGIVVGMPTSATLMWILDKLGITKY